MYVSSTTETDLFRIPLVCSRTYEFPKFDGPRRTKYNVDIIINYNNLYDNSRNAADRRARATVLEK
jgi:hypothetical protein